MDLDTILEAGEKHFFAKQYSDVKLDNIANELWIKKPSLYYYFTNKREFYIKTLKFSMKKYASWLRENVESGNLGAFLARYLEYPSKNHNLYAIAAQKWYGDDREINSIIEMWKRVINRDIWDFLRGFNIAPITMYVVCQLLDKLAMENCIDGYCLEHDIPSLTDEIKRIMNAE